MKRAITLLSIALIIMISLPVIAQVSINTDGADPDASAMLDVKSTISGLLVPRMTMTERNAINGGTFATGLLIYQLDSNPGYYYYDGSAWRRIVGGNDGDWTISGSNMYSGVSGNIGIGTNSPDNKLHLRSTGTDSEDLLRLDNDNSAVGEYLGIRFSRLDGVDDMARIAAIADGPNTRGIIFETNPGGGVGLQERVRMLGNGYVGIGTTNPGEKLDVSGNIRVSGTVDGYDISTYGPYFINSAGTSGQVWTSDGTDAGIWGSANNHAHELLTGGTGLAGGNYNGSTAKTWSVLYGTTTGTAVQGNQTATITAGSGLTGGISGDALGDGFTTTINHQDLSSQGSVNNGGGVVIQSVYMGSLGHVTNLNSVNLDTRYTQGGGTVNYLAKWVGSKIIGNSLIYESGSNIGIGTSSLYQKFNVAGGAYFSGNVGIGTYSPTSNLHVQGNMRLTGRLYDVYNYGGLSGQVLSSTGNGVDWVDAGDTDWYISGSNIYSYVGGNVGIGTSNPESKLHVEGVIEVDQKIQANDSGGLELATDEGTTRIQISDNGNVGIGTSSPSHNLHIQGNLRLTGRLYDATTYSGSPGQVLSSTGSGVDWVNADDADWTISGSNMYSAVSGNVGIGTTSFYQRLSVGGGGYFSGNVGIGTTSFYQRLSVGGGGYFSGYVGIGTPSPSSSLEVTGDIELDGGLYAPAAQENLRMLRGHVNATGSTSGVGWTANQIGTGTYTIYFASSFPGLPTCVATCYDDSENFIEIRNKTTNSFVVGIKDDVPGGVAVLQNTAFEFIVIGPR